MIKAQTVDGLKIAYWMNDDGWVEGRKILFFVHGSGGDHTNWEYQYRDLHADFNILAVDLPGHGQSEGKGEQEVARYVEWVRKLIEALSLPEPVLIGHSLGAAISLTFAVHHSSLISGIIPVGGGVKMPVNSLILDGIRKDTASVISLIVKFAVAKENRERLAERLTKGLTAANPEVMYGDFLSCDRLDITEEISRIQVPTLLVCGEDDKMTPPALSQFMEGRIPGAKLVLIPRAGHFVMMENPEAFNKAVRGFVEKDLTS
ncbi:MAG: alpha/beta hydrolase [Syntrophobacterales bacterium]|nr:alpha/beta hydrolase [Syntrophobacterales bacterium]